MAVFDAISWPDPAGRPVARAFLSLPGHHRFPAAPPEQLLPALLQESAGNQEEITRRRGVQMRQASGMLPTASCRHHLFQK